MMAMEKGRHLHLWWPLRQERCVKCKRWWWRWLNSLGHTGHRTGHTVSQGIGACTTHGHAASHGSGYRSSSCTRCNCTNSQLHVMLRAIVFDAIRVPRVVLFGAVLINYLESAYTHYMHSRTAAYLGTTVGATIIGGFGCSCFSSIFLKFSKKEPSLQNVFFTLGGGCSTLG